MKKKLKADRIQEVKINFKTDLAPIRAAVQELKELDKVIVSLNKKGISIHVTIV